MTTTHTTGVHATLTALFAAATLGAQDGQVVVPNSVLRDAARVLPQTSSAARADRLPDAPNLIVDQTCRVRIIALHDGAGYRNSIGWFTWDRVGALGDPVVRDSGIAFRDFTFPNQGSVTPGQAVALRDAGGVERTFTPGETLGFFLIADGFRTARDTIDNATAGSLPKPSPDANAAIGRGVFSTVGDLNPEAKNGDGRIAHAIMVEMPGRASFLDGEDWFLVGFEDLRRDRGSDDDFNDVMFAVQASPPGSLRAENVSRYVAGDPDGDGVRGARDRFPNDAERAFDVRYPSRGWLALAFEDKYPKLGDGDYDDAVVALAYSFVTDSRNRVKDLVAEFHLVARGASYDHLVGLHLPNLPASATGEVTIERYTSAGSHSVDTRALAAVIANDARRIPDLVPSTSAALPARPGEEFTNTVPGVELVTPASTRLIIEFDIALSLRVLGRVPFDPYLGVRRWTREAWDVHLPGRSGFDDRPDHLPVESGRTSFVDDAGMPWALLLPGVWRFPLEKVDIRDAYPRFDSWHRSGGRRDRDWYLHPVEDDQLVSAPVQALVPRRRWTVTP